MRPEQLRTSYNSVTIRIRKILNKQYKCKSQDRDFAFRAWQRLWHLLAARRFRCKSKQKHAQTNCPMWGEGAWALLNFDRILKESLKCWPHSGSGVARGDFDYNVILVCSSFGGSGGRLHGAFELIITLDFNTLPSLPLPSDMRLNNFCPLYVGERATR